VAGDAVEEEDDGGPRVAPFRVVEPLTVEIEHVIAVHGRLDGRILSDGASA
jgi:hypothetical protein